MKLITKIFLGILTWIFLYPSLAFGRTVYVSIRGDDLNPGTQSAPLRTIQHASDLAMPGDTIIVHGRVYREYINPPRGGRSDLQRIVYEAAPGEHVLIKGSEIIKNWMRVNASVWQVKIANSFFGNFNLYGDIIHGDWFNPRARVHHTGAVYLNGKWLTEAAGLNDDMSPVGKDALWFGTVDEDTTTIRAHLKGVNPNKHTVEINVRQSVFYPRDTGINYITVRSFTMEDAATPWAPPTAQQIGLIGPNCSKGWIIENNVIRYSMCSGISLGKYGDQWDNTSENTAGGYVKTIKRALQHGWSKEHIGHHIVKNNIISHCSKGWFAGAEMAGIKLHAAVDVRIMRNHIYNNTCYGIWLDWMAQGTRVSRNLLNNNPVDLFVEVNHGPFIIDNNIFLSPVSISTASQDGAYIHNLFNGKIHFLYYDARKTPILKPHTTKLVSLRDNPMGDNRFYNNLFLQRCDLSGCNTLKLPSKMNGNVFLDGAKFSKDEDNPLADSKFDPDIKLIKKSNGYYLQNKIG
jgi:alpha-N-arabinofuranosidase